MQIFDQDNGAYWEVFATSNAGLYAYLFDKNDGHKTYTIDKSWAINKKFSLKAVVSNGVLSFYYNNALNQ